MNGNGRQDRQDRRIRRDAVNGGIEVRDGTGVIRCEHDGLKMAELKRGHLILRARHHGEMHVQIVPLRMLLEDED